MASTARWRRSSICRRDAQGARWWCDWEGVRDYRHNPWEHEVDPSIRLRPSSKTGELKWYCDWCFDLEEPRLRPNNRDRCHELLLQAFPRSRIADLHLPILRLIAEYLADNVRGGDIVECSLTRNRDCDSCSDSFDSCIEGEV